MIFPLFSPAAPLPLGAAAFLAGSPILTGFMLFAGASNQELSIIFRVVLVLSGVFDLFAGLVLFHTLQALTS